MYNYESEPKLEESLFIGLDLGQAKDYTALAIIKRITQTGGQEVSQRFDCIHLQRWQLRTSYPTIVADVVRMISNLPSNQFGLKPVLAVDATGVGAPVVDLFKKESINAELRPIQIVGGAVVSNEPHITRVPKRELVRVVQVGLQNKTFKIAANLAEAATLARELQNFQVKITDSANDTYGAWREGTHDDLVLAAALALWTANCPSLRVTEREKDIFRAMTW